MRLWHKDLIEVLPNQQLLGQWREIFAIYRDYMREQTGISKKSVYAHHHPLVKYINDVDIIHFLSYANLVRKEMQNRNFNINEVLMKEIEINLPLTSDKIFFNYHDDEYYEICFYNLNEKFIRGSISSENWKRIAEQHQKKNNKYI